MEPRVFHASARIKNDHDPAQTLLSVYLVHGNRYPINFHRYVFWSVIVSQFSLGISHYQGDKIFLTAGLLTPTSWSEGGSNRKPY